MFWQTNNKLGDLLLRLLADCKLGSFLFQETSRTLLPRPLQRHWLFWMSWAAVLVPMMVRPLLMPRCITLLSYFEKIAHMSVV